MCLANDGTDEAGEYNSSSGERKLHGEVEESWAEDFEGEEGSRTRSMSLQAVDMLCI